MLGPEGKDHFGRKRYTGKTLVALPSEVGNRESIASKVGILLEETEITTFDWEKDVFPEFGVATIPLSPSIVEDAMIDRPALRGLIVEREHYVYTPQPLPCGEITPDPLKEMKVDISQYSGDGIYVGVLDTGYADHPDFHGRNITTTYHIGTDAVDIDGHGTHCIGLACGPQSPAIGRYGVAYKSSILSARVMFDRGTGTDSSVLAGMREAWRRSVHVVSLSLGSSVQLDEPYSFVFEIVARLMLDRKILTIAAAGNDPAGARYPVERPANCPSIMAVAAVDHEFKVWDRSCVARNDCQSVDIAAPGECIRSTSLAGGYAYESGTSMAAAFVSGIAALWAEKGPAYRGRRLWKALRSKTKSVASATVADVGRGLIQAPQ